MTVVTCGILPSHSVSGWLASSLVYPADVPEVVPEKASRTLMLSFSHLPHLSSLPHPAHRAKCNFFTSNGVSVHLRRLNMRRYTRKSPKSTKYVIILPLVSRMKAHCGKRHRVYCLPFETYRQPAIKFRELRLSELGVGKTKIKTAVKEKVLSFFREQLPLIITSNDRTESYLQTNSLQVRISLDLFDVTNSHTNLFQQLTVHYYRQLN